MNYVTLFNKFYNDCYKKYCNYGCYNFKLLDEQCGTVKENTHTNILMKLLEYRNQYGYVFFEDFISSLTSFNINLITGDKIKFKKEYFARTNGKQGRIDGLIYQENNFAIILENKVNRAPNQDDQLERYIKHIIGEDAKKEILVDLNHVYIIYLTQAGVEEPDEESRKYMMEIGILNKTDNSTERDEPLTGPRYFSCSYLDHILPWLEERVLPIVMQKEIMLKK